MQMRIKLNRGLRGLAPALLALGLAGGCSTDTEMGGVRVPNAAPDTRVTGQPPTLLEAGYAVEFRWTGSDPDGRIRGYQWKLSNNGTDGISPQDTLTVDPLTGAVLHPWRFTASTDSTFLVLADLPDFPGDTVDPRSYRSHSLFIRAVDDKGAVDPTPAYISFTSTTIVPTCRVAFPSLGGNQAFAVPRSMNIGWEGQDPDFELRIPTRVRYLWIPAVDRSGAPIVSRYQFEQVYAEVLSYDDPRWSQWQRYLPEEEDRVVLIRDQDPGTHYFFATQVQDTAGAVSVGFGYQQEVAHLVAREGQHTPDVTIFETYLPANSSSRVTQTIAGGQPLNFSWTANASAYNGKIVSMRHGWDIIDPLDPNDPGWVVPPGLSEQNRKAAERSYNEGLHTFTLAVHDDADAIPSIFVWTLRVVPFVDRDFQLELMVLDQIFDRNSNGWFSRDNRPLNNELYRDAYWRFLAAGAGGVADLNWNRDYRGHSTEVNYEDIVGYKAVLCYAHVGTQSVLSRFRPVGRLEKYVWLNPYQEQGGNFMLVGAQSMDSFLDTSLAYMTPLVFDTREDPVYSEGGRNFTVAFGTLELPDGSIVYRGPRMYPYATVGIAALDWTSATSKTIYGRPIQMSVDRNRLCSGLKGLVLAPAFKANHLIGPGVIPDTMYTDTEIDWRDDLASAADTLSLFDETAFVWDNDEFIDANLSRRATPITPQPCAGDAYAEIDVPNGLCIEPMFTGIARIDWMRERQWRRGRPDWPQSRYANQQLDSGCGGMALTEWAGRARASARTNGRVFGYLSYKKAPTKQFKRADIYWGFDPYRFDHQGTQKAIRWALQYFGLRINQ